MLKLTREDSRRGVWLLRYSLLFFRGIAVSHLCQQGLSWLLHFSNSAEDTRWTNSDIVLYFFLELLTLIYFHDDSIQVGQKAASVFLVRKLQVNTDLLPAEEETVLHKCSILQYACVAGVIELDSCIFYLFFPFSLGNQDQVRQNVALDVDVQDIGLAFSDEVPCVRIDDIGEDFIQSH